MYEQSQVLLVSVDWHRLNYSETQCRLNTVASDFEIPISSVPSALLMLAGIFSPVLFATIRAPVGEGSGSS